MACDVPQSVIARIPVVSLIAMTRANTRPTLGDLELWIKNQNRLIVISVKVSEQAPRIPNESSPTQYRRCDDVMVRRVSGAIRRVHAASEHRRPVLRRRQLSDQH